MKLKYFIYLLGILNASISSSLQAQELKTESFVTKNTFKQPNIIRLSPISVMDLGVGLGCSYEYLLSGNSQLGIILPVNLVFDNKEEGYNSNASNQFNTYVYFTPGVKIYTGTPKKVNYAFGPSLLIGWGKNSDWRSVSNANAFSASVNDYTVVRWRFGLLFNNYLNIRITDNILLGLEGGLGVQYVDIKKYSSQTLDIKESVKKVGIDVTGQFALTLGYQF